MCIRDSSSNQNIHEYGWNPEPRVKHEPDPPERLEQAETKILVRSKPEPEKKKGPSIIDIWANTIDQGLVPRVLFTSNRHQMGKTNTMIRLAEKVQEEIHSRKFSIDDCTLTCLEFMQRRKAVAEWTPLQLDEPERPVGNKSSFDTEAQLFVEDLMTSPFRHIPGMFALPHSHFLNLSIFGVCTSLIVKLSKVHAQLYELERDQLNRNFKTYTWLRGSFKAEPAYSWDWEKYIRKREDFDTKRGRVLEEKVAALHVDTRDLSPQQIYQLVSADPKRFTDPKKGRVTQALVMERLDCSFQSSRYASGKFNRMQRELELAESDKIAPS